MPSGPDPLRARTAAARLATLRDLLAESEDDVLASLVVTGEPRPQRVLDDWLDQVVDTLRALGETLDEVSLALAPHVDHAPSDGPAPETTGPGHLREVDR